MSTYRVFAEWVYTLIGVALLFKWLASDDLAALVLMCLMFTLAKLEGMRA